MIKKKAKLFNNFFNISFIKNEQTHTHTHTDKHIQKSLKSNLSNLISFFFVRREERN